MLSSIPATRFSPVMPLSLPKIASKMSNYSISRESVMSEQELALRNKKDKEIFRVLREARSSFRLAASKSKNLKLKEASQVSIFEQAFSPLLRLSYEKLLKRRPLLPCVNT